MSKIKKAKAFLFQNSSDGQTIAKNSFWLFFAEGIQKIIMFILVVFFARYFGVSGYGKLSFVLSFTAIFFVFSDFGLATLAMREIAKKHSLAKKYLINGSFLKLFLGIFSYLLIIIISQFLDKSEEIKMLLYFFGIYVVINSFNEFYRSIFRGFEKMEYEAYSKIIQSILMLIFFGILFIGRFELISVSLIYILSSFFTMCAIFTFLIIKLKRIREKVDISFVKNLIKQSWMFGLSIIFINLYYYIDTIMLSIMDGDYVTGIYNAAYNLLLVIIFIIAIYINSVYSTLSRLYTQDLKKFRDVVYANAKIVFFVSIAVLISFQFLSPFLIHIIYGNAYDESIKLFNILIYSSFFIYNGAIFGICLQVAYKQLYYLLVTFAGVIINVSANFILIPMYSAKGAAAATILTEFCVSALFLFLYIRFIPISRKAIT